MVWQRSDKTCILGFVNISFDEEEMGARIETTAEW